jgi:hypothetical protein
MLAAQDEQTHAGMTDQQLVRRLFLTGSASLLHSSLNKQPVVEVQPETAYRKFVILVHFPDVFS